MAKTYHFFRPSRLPLVAAALDTSSVLPLEQDEVHASLRSFFPALQWESPSAAQAEVGGRWLEFHLQPDGDGITLALRCSFRADYRDIVQGLCDRFGWVAFDEAPLCFQPYREPILV